MLTITNPKVAGLVPRWAEFRGFSLLFDNPGSCLARRAKVLELKCDVAGDDELRFYRGLRTTLESLDLDLLTRTYLFCPLPPHSYHVTVWDGGNDGNCAQVLEAQRPLLEDLLAGLPESLSRPSEVTEIPLRCPLVTRPEWRIRFRLDSLALWGDAVLVARLATADEASDAVFQALMEERRRLNARYREAFGISASDSYVPHVSLGYFANQEGAQMAAPFTQGWNGQYVEQLRGMTLEFERISLYGFTDMATFFKAVDD